MLIRFLMYLTLFFFTRGYSYEYNICIASIFQNEAPYMHEWIQYHSLVGVEHFCLYNNNSTDNFREVLEPYIQSGLVELIDWPSTQEKKDWNHYCYDVQPMAYTNAINKLRGKSKWVALIDLDEFIVPVKDNTIIECLENNFSQVSGLCVNWQCYGTSNVKIILPGELMIEKLVFKMKTNHPHNKHCKSIVKPEYISSCTDPHFCNYISGHYNVNAFLQKMKGSKTNVHVDKIRINHYWTRDEFYLNNIKIPRYQKWCPPKFNINSILKLAEEMNQEEDNIIHRFYKKLSIINEK